MKKENLNNVKKTGFKTPNQYFDSFEDKLMERIAEKEAIGTENTGFKVPDNYFETLETRVIQNIENESDTKIIQLKPKRTLYYITGIAASVVLLISIMLTNNKTVSFDNIDTVAIESYLYQEEYSNEDLATLFQSVEISDTDFIDVNISEDTFNDYLESIDTEDLIID